MRPWTLRILLSSASLALVAGVHAAAWPTIRAISAHDYPAYGLWRLTASVLRDAIGSALPWALAAGAAFAGLALGLATRWPVWRQRLADHRLSPIIALGAAHLAAVTAVYGWPALYRAAGSSAPDVVFIVVDTLRQDHLGFAGYSRPTSPHLDRLAAESITFENAFAQAPWTSPSVASLLTSRYPGTLGFASSGGPAVAADNVLFLAEILADHGYDAHAVVSNAHVGSRLGFGQGMSTFDEDNAQGQLHVSSASVTDKAIALLDAASGRNRFLFLHYFDPHFSYLLHEDFDFDPDYRGDVGSGMPHNSLLVRAREPSFSDRDVRHLLALYDSEIRFTDQHLGRLFRHLRDSGRYDDTLIVFTADHGESFLDRTRWIGHGRTLFNELIHVPLLVKLPAGASAGTRVKTPVALIDVVPSLLDVLGLRPPRGDVFEGRILPLANPDALRQLGDEPIFSETMAQRRWLQSVVMGQWKLIANPEKGWYRLHDLEADPGERTNIARGDPQTTERLAKILRPWAARIDAARHEGAVPDFTEEERERLRALGYLQ